MTSTLVESVLLEEMERQTRRSRLSLHFNTRRRRRWLLIQLVSVPVSALLEREREQSSDEVEMVQRPTTDRRNENWPDAYSRLLDNYTNTMHMNRPR
jgi:hypothetical protein